LKLQTMNWVNECLNISTDLGRVALIERIIWQKMRVVVLDEIDGRRYGLFCRQKAERKKAVLWMARSGAPWSCLPETYGQWFTAYHRLHWWSRFGVCLSVLLRTLIESISLLIQRGFECTLRRKKGSFGQKSRGI